MLGVNPENVAQKWFLRSSIGLYPYKGYAYGGKQWSVESMLWLRWRQHQQPKIPIKHALHGGEKQVYVNGHTYALDGYYVDPITGQ